MKMLEEAIKNPNANPEDSINEFSKIKYHILWGKTQSWLSLIQVFVIKI